MARRLKLDDQGFLEFYEGTAGGTNKITVQGPATLASDYTVTLPNAQGAADTFLKNDGAGGLTWGTSTATLQSAYDNGTKIDADGTEVEIEVAAASANVALLLDQDDNQHALSITKDGTAAGSGANILNAGTGNGIFLDQDGNGIALNIDSEATSAVGISLDMVATATGDAIDIVQAGDAIGIDLNKTGTGAGVALDVQNVGTGDGILINQDGNGIALSIDSEATSAVGINVDMAAAATGDAINIVQAGDAIGIDLNKTGTGAGIALDVQNVGTGNGCFLNQDGNGIALDIDSEATSAVGINVDMQASATGDAINIIQAGDAIGIDINKTGTGAGVALDVQNAGTGIGCFLNQDGNGIALDIDSEATGQPLINLAPVVGNTRGDIAFGTARTADPSSPSEGDLWWDSTADRVNIANAAGQHLTLVGSHGPWAGRTSAPAVLVSGVATVGAFGIARIAAETGTADDLDTITASTAHTNDTIILRADAGDTITVKHGTGNISLDGSADKALVNGNQLMLVFNSSTWEQLTPMMVLP